MSEKSAELPLPSAKPQDVASPPKTASRDARPLFFSGGTALRDASRALAKRNRHSVHLLTTFDSGGSSAVLRQTFAMPAVGDIRNRLVALADAEIVPQAALEFFCSRLPADGDAHELRSQLKAMGKASHAIWKSMPDAYAQAFRLHLGHFLQRMPPNFDARLASLGNLLLAGGYLRHKRDLTPPIALFSQLLHVRGAVLPTVEESLHLAAKLENGSLVVGQHHFKALPAPVSQLLLTVHEPERREEALFDNTISCRPRLSAVAAEHLRTADAICYPMGSFYSSLLANLLPSGVGRAIAGRACPKIFIPNSGHDAELCGLGLVQQVALILRVLREDAPAASTCDLLHLVVVDSRHGRYEGGLGPETMSQLKNMGLNVLDRQLIAEAKPERHDPEALADLILELCVQR